CVQLLRLAFYLAAGRPDERLVRFEGSAGVGCRRRQPGSSNAELLRVLAAQSLPAGELHDLGADHAANGLTGERVIQHVKADVPARGAPGDEAVIDVVPECETRAAAERLQFPPEVATPAELEQPRSLGSLHGGLGYLRRADGRELHRPDGRQTPIGVVRRPLPELRRVGQRLPNLLRRVTEFPD